MSVRKHIPNAITCLNAISGCVAIYFSFKGNFTYALLAVLAAAAFDFLDGLAARTLHAYSDVGKELDSLCDVVSFGVAPSMMIVNFMLLTASAPVWICFIPILIAVFSALRLAKFNLDTRQSENFIGLPVPADALFFCSLVAYADYSLNAFNSLTGFPLFLPLLSVVFSYLLVSEMPFFSMKFKSISLKANQKRYIFIVLAVLCVIAGIVIGIRWEGILFYVLCIYLIVNAVSDIFGR